MENYYFFYGDFNNLNKLFLKNTKLKDTYNKIITKARGYEFNYLNLKKEAIIYIDKTEYSEIIIKTYYYFTCNEDDIISIAKIQIDNNNNIIEGLIYMVYVNENYRGNKVCQKTVKHIIELTNKKIKKIKLYKLVVYKDNIPAVRCYQACNFNIVNEFMYNNKPSYKMIYEK
jgi:predicted GNAT family N-acyltransferase